MNIFIRIFCIFLVSVSSLGLSAKTVASATLHLVLNIPKPEEIYEGQEAFGVSSVPVNSWSDKPDEVNPVTVKLDGSESQVYVFWKYCTTTADIGISMSRDNPDDKSNWKASWECDGEDVDFSSADGYKAKDVYNGCSDSVIADAGCEPVGICFDELPRQIASSSVVRLSVTNYD